MPLTAFAKSSLLDVSLGSEYAAETCNDKQEVKNMLKNSKD